MPIPIDGWKNGGWQWKQPHFYLQGEMVGLKNPTPSPGELQAVFDKIFSTKVFIENIEPFLEATGMTRKQAIDELEYSVNVKLGLMDPVPFMSPGKGMASPASFDGVAVIPPGTYGWMLMRLNETLGVMKMGARFRRIILFGSSRQCNSPMEHKHPDIQGIPESEEPTERDVFEGWTKDPRLADIPFFLADLPEPREDGKPHSFEAQLRYGVESGQFEELVGSQPVYAPATPNSLYVPLHVQRVWGLPDIHLSQPGARTVRKMPDHYDPHIQDILTTPNGSIRLWKELIQASYIKNG